MYMSNHEGKLYTLCIVHKYSDIFFTVLIIPGELCDVTVHYVLALV